MSNLPIILLFCLFGLYSNSQTNVSSLNISSLYYATTDDTITNQEDELTVSVRVYGNPSNPGVTSRFISEARTGDWKMGHDNNTKTMYFSVNVGGSIYRVDAPQLYNLLVWEMFTGVYDRNNGTIEIYRDSILEESLSGIPNLDMDTSIDTGFSIIYRPILLDDLHIWDRALSQQEITDYVNCPPSGNEANLLAYWSCEVGIADTLFDSSPNQHNLLFQGAYRWMTTFQYNCPPVGIQDYSSQQNRELIGIYDVLGRETQYKPNTVLIYRYTDGSVEKVLYTE